MSRVSRPKRPVLAERANVENGIRANLRRANRVARVSAVIASVSLFGAMESEKLGWSAVSIPGIASAFVTRKRARASINGLISDYRATKPDDRSPMVREELVVKDGRLSVKSRRDPQAKVLEGPTSFSPRSANVPYALFLQQLGSFGGGAMAGALVKVHENLESGKIGPVVASNGTDVLGAPAGIFALCLVAGSVLETQRLQMGPYLRQLDNIDGPAGIAQQR